MFGISYVCSGAERLRRRWPRRLLAGTPGLQYFCSPRRPGCCGAVAGAICPFCLPGYKFLLVNAFKLPVLASAWQASYFILFSIPSASFHPYHNQGSELILKNAAPPGKSMAAALWLDRFSINTNCIRHSWFTGTHTRHYPCFVLC